MSHKPVSVKVSKNKHVPMSLEIDIKGDEGFEIAVNLKIDSDFKSALNAICPDCKEGVKKKMIEGVVEAVNSVFEDKVNEDYLKNLFNSIFRLN